MTNKIQVSRSVCSATATGRVFSPLKAPLNPDAVVNQGEPVCLLWTYIDALLYAVGVGAEPDESQYTTDEVYPVKISWTVRLKVSGRFAFP